MPLWSTDIADKLQMTGSSRVSPVSTVSRWPCTESAQAVAERCTESWRSLSTTLDQLGEPQERQGGAQRRSACLPSKMLEIELFSSFQKAVLAASRLLERHFSTPDTFPGRGNRLGINR